MATMPVRPHVDDHGIEWRRRERFWFEGNFGPIATYVVTFNQRLRDSWDVQILDGLGPVRRVDDEVAVAVVSGLKEWLRAQGLEVPGETRA